MRTLNARKSIYTALLGLVAAGVVAVAADKFSVRAKMNTGKPAANLPVFLEVNGQQTPLGTTNANGDFELAMDSSKNGKEFAIYRENCSKLVIRARDPQREEECRRQSEQEKDKECKTCELVGLFVWGEGGGGGGIGAKGGAAIVGGTLLSVIVGKKTVGNGKPAAPSGQTKPAFVSRNGQSTLTLTAVPGGCANFQPGFTATLTVSGHSSADAAVTAALLESILRTYTGRITNNVFDGTGSGQFPSGRRYTATLRVVFNDQGQIVQVLETLNVEASATSAACVISYERR